MGFAVGIRAQSAWAWVKQQKPFTAVQGNGHTMPEDGIAAGTRAQAARAWVHQQKPFTAVQGNGHPILHMHGVVCSVNALRTHGQLC